MVNKKRVLVCGGRDFKDKDYLFEKMNELHAKYGFEAVITGGAEGADELAGHWAWSQDVKLIVFHAAWAKHGRSAGPIRNQKMLFVGRPGLVVAFPGGKGTADMVKRTKRERQVELIEVGERT